MDYLAEDLPLYRVNIRSKIADVRGAGKGGSVEKLQETIEEIKTGIGEPEGPRRRAVTARRGHLRGRLGFVALVVARSESSARWERPRSS